MSAAVLKPGIVSAETVEIYENQDLANALGSTAVPQTVINGAILNRLAGQRDGSERGGVWVQALSSNMDQDGRGGDNGYSANSSGVAVGVAEGSRLAVYAPAGALQGAPLARLRAIRVFPR